MSVLALDIEKSVKKLTADLDDKEKEIRRATKRAQNAFVTWMERQMTEILVRTSDLPLGVLKSRDRIFSSTEKNPFGELTKMWFGINGVRISDIATPVQVEGGVKIPGFPVFKGAFLIQRFDHAAHAYRRKDKGRWSLESVKHEFSDKTLFHFNMLEKKAMPKFESIMRKELEYALNE